MLQLSGTTNSIFHPLSSHSHSKYPSSSVVPACQCTRHGFHPWIRTIPWRRKWQPTPIFLPGKSHGQRSLAGNTPWGCKQQTMTQRWSVRARARTHTHVPRCGLHSMELGTVGRDLATECVRTCTHPQPLCHEWIEVCLCKDVQHSRR